MHEMSGEERTTPLLRRVIQVAGSPTIPLDNERFTRGSCFLETNEKMANASRQFLKP